MRPVHLDLKPSYVLAAIFASAGVGACLILACMPLPLWLKLGLGVMVAASSAYHIMDALLKLPWSLVELELTGKGELHVLRRDGQKLHVTLSSGSVVTPTLTLLNLKTASLRWQRHMLITPDRVDSDIYRRLRVWLRWSRQAISGDDVLEEA